MLIATLKHLRDEGGHAFKGLRELAIADFAWACMEGQRKFYRVFVKRVVLGWERDFYREHLRWICRRSTVDS